MTASKSVQEGLGRESGGAHIRMANRSQIKLKAPLFSGRPIQRELLGSHPSVASRRRLIVARIDSHERQAADLAIYVGCAGFHSAKTQPGKVVIFFRATARGVHAPCQRCAG